jgi:hypothetical protein
MLDDDLLHPISDIAHVWPNLDYVSLIEPESPFKRPVNGGIPSGSPAAKKQKADADGILSRL